MHANNATTQVEVSESTMGSVKHTILVLDQAYTYSVNGLTRHKLMPPMCHKDNTGSLGTGHELHFHLNDLDVLVSSRK